MLAPVRTVAPSGALVSTAEAKAHLRVDFSDEDSYIDSLALAAMTYLDGYTGRLGRAILTQTWSQEFSAFDDKLRLAVGDLQAVSSVTYYDATNTQQTLAAAVYVAATDSLGPYISLKPGQTWPSTYTRQDAVKITWTAGYGIASAVPSPIKQAALLLIGHWYAAREAAGEAANATELPFAVEALLAPYIRNRI